MSDLTDEVNLCWIASYPRSGNTFFRIAMSNVIFGAGEAKNVDLDMPEYVHPHSLQIGQARRTSTSLGDVIFAKTHYYEPPAVANISTVFGIYIYRHPLDVFLSSLNYLYINAGKIPEFRRYFLNSLPRPVEQIANEGDLDYYLALFTKNDGMGPFRHFSGGWSQSLVAWHAAASFNENIICWNYTAVVLETESVVSALTARMGMAIDPEVIAAGVARARMHTKSDGKFYWKGRAGSHHEYLSSEQINRYFAANERRWQDLGISFIRQSLQA